MQRKCHIKRLTLTVFSFELHRASVRDSLASAEMQIRFHYREKRS